MESSWRKVEGPGITRLAGDLAVAELGHESLIAADLVRFLPAAFEAYRKQAPGQSE